MATPLHFITSNNDPNTTTSPNTNTNQWSIINPTQQPTTNHHYNPILKPGSNPKPRGRKSGNKSQNGHKNKTPQRGVGMAELERLRLLDEQHSSHSNHTTSTISGNNGAINRPVVTDPRVNPSFHHSNPLSGVPVIRYCLPSQPVSDSRLTHRVGIPESASAPYYPELPSMPNPSPLDHSILTSFKKKRVIGEETIGFSKGYNSHFGGFDLKNGDNYNHYLGISNGGFSALPTTNTNGSEVVAIHRKWSGTGNVMMEYGFFPGKSEENTIIKLDSDNNNTINNYYNKMEDLNLKMGFISDSSSPSPSPSSSSLSSLTTTTTTTSNSSVDLSLKLSTF